MLPLSPIDSIFVGAGSYTIEFLFHFPQGLDAARMRTALERVLETRFSPLRCTLGTAPDGRLAFVPSTHEVTVSERMTADRAELDDDLAAHAAYVDSVRALPGEPLCKLKITHVANGSVLGVSISHALTDGFSFFSFLYAWSQETIGATSPEVNHERWRLAPTEKARPFSREEFERRIGFAWANRRGEAAVDDVRRVRRRYSREELAQMTAAGGFSVNDAVCADLWRTVAERLFVAVPEVSLTTPIDFRRLFDRVPKNYIGNAVMLARTSLPTRKLLAQDLATTARLIRQSIEQVDARRCDDTVSLLDALRTREGALEEVHVRHPENGLLVTNLSRMPVQHLDFGTGLPAYAVSLNRDPRLAHIMADADGGLVTQVTLPAHAAAPADEILLAG